MKFIAQQPGSTRRKSDGKRISWEEGEEVDEKKDDVKHVGESVLKPKKDVSKKKSSS